MHPLQTNPSLPPIIRSRWDSALQHPFTYIVLTLAIMVMDLFTGPWLTFPILFVAPVSLCAWHAGARCAYGLAVLLPFGRLLIAGYVEESDPLHALLINFLVRAVVLGGLAYFVARTARLTRELQDKLTGLVTICAWSRTIEYEGEWISVEEYLKRRFNLDTSHGIAPMEAEKFLAGRRGQSPPIAPQGQAIMIRELAQVGCA